MIEDEEEEEGDDEYGDDKCVPDTPANLQELVHLLNSEPGLGMFHTAYRENMLHKVHIYGEMRETAEEAVQSALQVIHLKMPVLKDAAGVDPADSSCNWQIFDSISQTYLEAKDRASQFEAIQQRARECLGRGDAAVESLRDQLVVALESLSNFPAQTHIVTKIVDLVSSFLKDPRLFRHKLMNFMLMGSAGTGKTLIAECIGDVFAKAGMFVGNRLIQAGRAELVGQYEGQTVARTRNFLTSNLDNGVIFIDEAYAITPWQDGKPEGYGSEAATAMVEFMTRYPGLYCIITAGYEKEMTRYFLPTNEGLSRRFPYKFVLHDMTANGMVTVFQRSMMKIQGLPVPNGRGATLESEGYFTPGAYMYLKDLIEVCTQGRVVYQTEEDPATRQTYRRVRTFEPRWELLYDIFKNQAGSMTLLADEAVTALMTTVTFADVIAAYEAAGSAMRPRFSAQSDAVMRAIVTQRINNSALSESEEFLLQLRQVEHIC
jgi:hypothetical protein